MEKLHITDFRETIKLGDARGAGHSGDVSESVIQRISLTAPSSALCVSSRGEMSDCGGGEDGGGMEVSAAVQTVADASVLQKHIRKLVPLLLEDGGDAPASLESALEEKSALEQMRKFLSDPQIHSILVERSALKGDNPPLNGH